MYKDELVQSFTDMLNKFFEEKLMEATNDTEAEKITDKLKKLDVVEMYNNYLDGITKESIENVKSNMYKDVLSFRADEQEFLAKQEQKWYKAFASSETLYIIVVQSLHQYSEFLDKLTDEEKAPKVWELTALRHIHGRALQQYLEVITLMKNGFADGAYARWRSMYELAIISSFISKYGEKVAEAFVKASSTNDRYDWAKASGIFSNKKKHINFSDIQKNCDIDSPEWRAQYDLANKTVHASPQGTFNRLGIMGSKKVIPIGRSDYGITTPAEHSALSLFQITTLYFSVFSCSKSVIMLRTMRKFIDIIREQYFKTHDELFPDDKPLWEDGMLDNKDLSHYKEDEKES